MSKIKMSSSVRRLNARELPEPKRNRFLEVVADRFPRKPGNHGWLYSMHYVRPGEVPDISNLLKVGKFQGGVANRLSLYRKLVDLKQPGIDGRLQAAIYDARKVKLKHYLVMVPHSHHPLTHLEAEERALREGLRAEGYIV